MIILKAIAIAILVPIVGDFLSTFLYHIPQHAFGKLHLTTHHLKDRGFSHYAFPSSQPSVLLDGILGISFYLLFCPISFPISVSGSILGYLLADLHIIWRHLSALGWQTPPSITRLCKVFFIVTPEFHWQHHENTHRAFGDVFTFYDAPARAWLKFLLGLKRQFRQRSVRS